jgi:hypothetical protein
MDEKLVTIAQYASYIEAELAKQKLDDFGIKSIVTGQNTAITYSIPAVGMVNLQTFESQAKQALEILESSEQQENNTEDTI